MRVNPVLHQRGRASIEFLVDLRLCSNPLEIAADALAQSHGLFDADLPASLDERHKQIGDVLKESMAFRMLRLAREWSFLHHGLIAQEAFEEVRPKMERELRAAQSGPTQIAYNDQLDVPDYWKDVEFHRTRGGWDGHDFMGYIHGELVHKRMVNAALPDEIFEQRRSVAALACAGSPESILEIGCGSAQYTAGLQLAYPESRIWACDLSARQLEQAQRVANERDWHWNLFQAAGEHTGLPDCSFDLVTSYAVHHELPRTVSAEILDEAYRLLKPGGVLLIADVTPYHVMSDYAVWKADYWNQIHGGDPFWREYATTNFRELAEGAGFANVEWRGASDATYPFYIRGEKI